jgi:hypothetical protein
MKTLLSSFFRLELLTQPVDFIHPALSLGRSPLSIPIRIPKWCLVRPDSGPIFRHGSHWHWL